MNLMKYGIFSPTQVDTDAQETSRASKFQISDKIPERDCPRYRITITIVTITQRILFSLATNGKPKNTVGRRWHYANSFDRKCKSA